MISRAPKVLNRFLAQAILGYIKECGNPQLAKDCHTLLLWII